MQGQSMQAIRSILALKPSGISGPNQGLMTYEKIEKNNVKQTMNDRW